MTQVRIKRVYETASAEDGYRVLVDRLWPRGMKKENLKYDIWEKDIAPSTLLRQWYHEDVVGRWDAFVVKYRKELEGSEKVRDFISVIKKYPVVTLLFASRDTAHNHASVLQEYIEQNLDK